MKKYYKINNRYKILLLLVISSVILISCGFHLRGEIKVPDVLKELYIEGDIVSNDFGTVLIRRIKQLGITKNDSKENSSAILQITKNNFTRRVLTVNAATKASAYKLDLVIGFELVDNSGESLLKNQQIRQTREYNIDPSNALASGDQENRLKLEMVEFIVNQMLTRMSFALKDKN